MRRIAMTMVLILVLITSMLAACTAPASQPQPAQGNEDITADVLVIGGGGAGLVSAITAAENGVKVILVEKMPAVGGNTIISATGITASDTQLHKDSGISFTVEDHYKRTIETGKGLADEKLVRVLVENSSAAYDWLVSLGLSYKIQSPEEPFWIVPTEGHYGAELVKALQAEAGKHKNLEIKLNTKATELITEEGKVVGAKVEGQGGEYVINAKAVILATGGLNNAPEMIAEYNPNYKGVHTEMTTPGPTGDGIKMAAAVGAQLRHMDLFQMRPLSSNGNWYKEVVISEEGKGGILVNLDGDRFVDETMKTWDLASEILKQKEGTAYIIFDNDVYETKEGKKTVEKGKGVKADTIEELAAQLGLDPAKLKATVDAYNAGQDPFNRKAMGKVTTAPFYGIKTLPSSHYTMGGVAINENAQVLKEDGSVIEGLYAAGEVVGGLYGAGRVAGNNTLDDIVFGKIAAKHAIGK
ncbi:fumarate reductase flavoprotein subunit [Geosporobacter subterraneus DSM 17957]|uniref:Fumarate reductase flavoprotein subunit n=1 Tax=Geosporobacter subterraneus DSM 17957 TaxID=1121919 RepID=A0A1M6MNK8_9FIRM|nr:flavocytochrome c [Geosporobacter subterraneus]SHJ84863.1 fumarate reductase flavoprotein subunit [Geosporobacter subterraneus DSM 17957]